MSGGQVVDLPRPVRHLDGSVSYWCPRRQRMVWRVRVVPREALASMSEADAEMALDHVDPQRARAAETVAAFTRRLVRRICRQLGTTERRVFAELARS